jgi:hypothetical protein
MCINIQILALEPQSVDRLQYFFLRQQKKVPPAHAQQVCPIVSICSSINENCYAMTFGGKYGYKEG